jgi:magnesium transporter
MITAYILNNKVLDIVTLGPDDIVPDNTVWLMPTSRTRRNENG